MDRIMRRHILCLLIAALIVLFVVHVLIDKIMTHGPLIKKLIETYTLIIEIAITIILLYLFEVLQLSQKGKRGDKAGIVFYSDNSDSKQIEKGERFLSEKNRVNRLSLCLQVANGWNTFGAEGAPLHEAIKNVRHARVMLLHPSSAATDNRAKALGMTPGEFKEQIRKSIDYLAFLNSLGKGGYIELKFYDVYPLWKYIIIGEAYIWVQEYPPKKGVKYSPCYVFKEKEDSLFHPFKDQYDKFWASGLPEFNFKSKEITYKDNTENHQGIPISSII